MQIIKPIITQKMTETRVRARITTHIMPTVVSSLFKLGDAFLVDRATSAFNSIAPAFRASPLFEYKLPVLRYLMKGRAHELTWSRRHSIVTQVERCGSRDLGLSGEKERRPSFINETVPSRRRGVPSRYVGPSSGPVNET